MAVLELVRPAPGEAQILLPTFLPEVIVYDRPEEVDEHVLMTLEGHVAEDPSHTLLTSTGGTQIAWYDLAVKAVKRGEVDLSQLKLRNQDEFYPLKPTHEGSYFRYMKTNLLDHVSVGDWAIPDGGAVDVDAEVMRYRRILAENPIDNSILGLGPGKTCHIGFSEQGTPIYAETRYVLMAPETVKVNRQYFDNPDDMPPGAITIGPKETLATKNNILMVVKGGGKAWGANRTLTGPISYHAPSSYLRTHRNFTMVMDSEAAADLPGSFPVTRRGNARTHRAVLL